LIEVPYWWDRKYESLAATIYSKRPDLFTEKPKLPPIPETPPHTEPQNKPESTFFNCFQLIPTDPAKNLLITATEWDSASMNPTGWIMTEKFDGMRLYWDGSQFFTRQGNIVKIPEKIRSQLPETALDGELWYFVCVGWVLTFSGLSMASTRMQFNLQAL
jgi:ATP-dependent DNA ligase